MVDVSYVDNIEDAHKYLIRACGQEGRIVNTKKDIKQWLLSVVHSDSKVYKCAKANDIKYVLIYMTSAEKLEIYIVELIN